MNRLDLRDLWKILQQEPLCRAGLRILTIFLAMAIFSPFFILINPSLFHPITGTDPHILGAHPPIFPHLLGTDAYSRDIFSQLLQGTQIALLVGILSAFLSVSLGVFVGMIAGYFSGFIDALLMRVTDIMLTLPGLPFLILIGAKVGKQSIFILIFLIAFFGWASVARVVRSSVLSLKQRGYVEQALIGGVPTLRIFYRYLLPPVLPIASLYIAFGVSGAIATEAALSFLGLGDASRISWGMMLQWATSTGHQFKAPYWVIPPGLCITFLSLAFYLLGKGLEQHILPRLKVHAQHS